MSLDPAILLISVSLAMDCFSVSVSSSACQKRFMVREALASATSFGSFQFLMLCAGWILGASLIAQIGIVDHWLAFALLSLVGVRMMRGDGELRMSSPSNLLLLSVATSMDALSAGMVISLMGAGMSLPALVTGASTFALTLTGHWLGSRVGRMLGEAAERAGGLLLILIGVKVLVEHLLSGS